ncbi:MAG: DUF455 family protein [Verrucomicrobiales bacterium]|nr:DUF455 family protein [Verrucomicrobiales bacterium]
MNVNEYAEKVLFSDDLDEKLRLSTETVDFAIQQTRISPNLHPGRPDSLLLEKITAGAKAALPSRPSLVDERSRGTLLHFFANHELLAAELMALALLKFPDAPIEFRKGLFATLQEEQKHTLWYLGRMKECGVTLGEFPVSRFFWDTVSPMETPFDYVSRLSLTFEQANLDYSRHFGKLMKEAGDPRTAKIMDRIYHDEIEHVGYGLKWFRHWKKHGQSDWDAYRERLQLPLSPSRAKGNGIDFNESGRLEAGLSGEFVRNLAVFEKSKGRSPNVFCFNPDAEDQIAAGRNRYRPGPKVEALIRDLEIVQIFLARQDDIVLMRNPPSLEHLERLREAGFQLPEFLSSETTPKERKLNSVKPWSCSPALPGAFEGWNWNGNRLWDEKWRLLFSKTEQASRFGEWMAGSRICKSPDAARDALADFPVVVKKPLSAAGRGVKFCTDRESAVKTAEKWLVEQGSVLIEPAHDRIFDFSVQFESSPEKMTQTGLIRQLIDPQGRYLGSISANKFCKGLPEELARFLMTEALPFFDEAGPLAMSLHNWLNDLGYSGPVGIDSYVYRTRNGDYAVRPVCEINPRYTMGRVAHEIRRAVSPGCSVKFQIDRNPPRLREVKPEINPANGKICSGTFCLNEIHPATCFSAIISVDKNPENLYQPVSA